MDKDENDSFVGTIIAFLLIVIYVIYLFIVGYQGANVINTFIVYGILVSILVIMGVDCLKLIVQGFVLTAGVYFLGLLCSGKTPRKTGLLAYLFLAWLLFLVAFLFLFNNDIHPAFWKIVTAMALSIILTAMAYKTYFHRWSD